MTLDACILDHLSTGCCTLSTDFKVIHWNTILEEWTGIPRGMIKGKNFFTLFPNLDTPRYRLRFKTVFDGGPPAIFSSYIHKYLVPCPLPEGGFRTQKAYFSRLSLDESEEPICLLEINDVTDLRRRISDLKRLAKMREKFFMACSHDLRSPLNAIIGLSEMLTEDKSVSKKAHLHINNINKSGYEILRLVDYLLKGITSTKVNENFLKIDICEIVKHCHETTSGLAKKKQIQYDMELPNQEIFIKGSILELTRALKNLIANAIKFTPTKGKITLFVQNNSVLVRFGVRDSGSGLSAEDINRIEDGERLMSKDGTAGESGTGLGVSIVREIAKDHEGKLLVESKLGQGSTFTLELPKINSWSSLKS